MKFAFVILPLCLFLNTEENIMDFRTGFHNLNSHEELKCFIKEYDNFSEKQSRPYVAAAIMRRAQYVIFPHKKLEYCSSGKNKIEAYISSNPDCFEGRYVRVLVQSEVPAILNYKSNIISDKVYIEENISKSDLPVNYRELISFNLRKL